MTGSFGLPPAVREMINAALEQKRPGLLAYVTAQGQPILSYRGSVQVRGSAQLSAWIRNPRGGLCAAIAGNPRVALMFRNEAVRATYHLQGLARIEADEAVREEVFLGIPKAEKDHDPSRGGVAVLIDLERINGWAGMGPGGPIDPIALVRSAA